MRYRGEVDGLRAVAVVPVILFHAGFGAFSGGFIGVDVFFVISGYLITTIIVDDIERGQFSIRRFYERRARRILPALSLVLLACIPFAWWLMDPFEMKEFGQSIVSTATFSSNVYFYLKTGYFDTASELKPLLHTWSLAVEEQFYIVFPVLLVLIWRFGTRVVVGTAILATVVSFWLAERGVQSAPSATFFLPHSRAWELSIGSLVALYLRRPDLRAPPAILSQGLTLAGLAMILLPVGLYSAETPFPGLYALPPVIGTSLIILFATPGTLVHRVLASRSFIAVGVLSYSAYLWHQPIFAFSRIYRLDELTPAIALAGIALTFLLAMATKRFVEDPARFRLLKGKQNAVLASAALVSVAFVAFGAFLHVERGLPGRSSLGLQLAQNYGLSPRCSGAALDDAACQRGADPATLLWGDSIAMHVGRAVAEAGDGVVQATLSACPPIIGYTKAQRRAAISCAEFNETVFTALSDKTFPSVQRVVMASTFGMLRDEDSATLLRETLEATRDLGYEVILLSPTPTHGAILKCIKQQSRGNGQFAACDFPQASAANQDIFDELSTIARDAGIRFVDLRELICADAQCTVKVGDTILYRDNIHLANGADQKVETFLRYAFAQP